MLLCPTIRGDCFLWWSRLLSLDNGHCTSAKYSAAVFAKSFSLINSPFLFLNLNRLGWKDLRASFKIHVVVRGLQFDFFQQFIQRS